MIELQATSASDQIEIQFSGHVSQSDYESDLVPAIKKALTENDQVRVLAIFGEGFKSFDMGAVWADTKMGLSHWRGFDRIAIATDSSWISIGARALAPMFPCPVQVFSTSETEAARRWLRESLGSIHLTELGGKAIQLKLLGKLDPDAFRRAEDGLSAHLREHGGLRLMLDLREFDGWLGISALGAHLNVVRTNVGQAERIAMVGNKVWQHMAERAASKILSAETQFFEAEKYDAAKVWLTES